MIGFLSTYNIPIWPHGPYIIITDPFTCRLGRLKNVTMTSVVTEVIGKFVWFTARQLILYNDIRRVLASNYMEWRKVSNAWHVSIRLDDPIFSVS